jgi:hypothetical protein
VLSPKLREERRLLLAELAIQGKQGLLLGEQERVRAPLPNGHVAHRQSVSVDHPVHVRPILLAERPGELHAYPVQEER